MIWLRSSGVALLLAGTTPVFAQAPLPSTLSPSRTPLTTAIAPIPGATTAGVIDPQSQYLAPGVSPDLAFAAFQRGYYVTALREAMKRITADPDDGPAMTLVGELYRDGLGLPRNPQEAVRWYKLAADRGDPPGAFALALSYLRGFGVKQDAQAAVPWLELAAVAGHPGAVYNLGMLALQGERPDHAKAASLFRRAAELGNSEAAYALGLQYRQGLGVTRDGPRAAFWLKRAADDNLAAAQIEYAILLFNGDGVPADESAALRYFRKAASANNPVAANRLARLLATGRGAPRNMIEAMTWHIIARAAGVPDEWLDSQLSSLSARDRALVEEAVRRHIGGA
jgi:TPR repeat protein